MDVSAIFSLNNPRKRYECFDWVKVFKLTDRVLTVAKDYLNAGNPKEAADMAIEWLQTFNEKFDEDIFTEYDEDGLLISETCKKWTEIIESAMSDANTSDDVKQAILNNIEKLSDCKVYWSYGFLDIASFIKRMKANNATGDEALKQLDELIKRERRANEYDSKLPELVNLSLARRIFYESKARTRKQSKPYSKIYATAKSASNMLVNLLRRKNTTRLSAHWT